VTGYPIDKAYDEDWQQQNLILVQQGECHCKLPKQKTSQETLKRYTSHEKGAMPPKI